MTVVPARVDLKIYQGSNFSQVLTFLQTAGGTPVDLTGLTGRMQIRQTLASSDFMVELTTANGRLAFGGVNGVVTMTLTAAETETILTDGVYDLEFVTNAAMPLEARKAELLATTRRLHCNASIAQGFTPDEAIDLCLATVNY